MSTGKTLSVREKVMTVRGMIEKMKDQITQALPRHMTAERMIRVVNTAIQKTPSLLDCEPRSLMGAIVQASQLGLEPDGVLGHAYLIPFNNRKSGKLECQFMPGYKGLIELARRSSQISTIYTHVVYENDEWDFQYGLEQKLSHKPTDGAPGLPIAVYAVARLRDGGVQFEWMWKREVETIRQQSKAGGSGPWVTHWDEMAKKTALRRLCKLLPTSPELSRAVALDEQAESSVPQGLSFLASMPGSQGNDDDVIEVEADADDAPVAIEDQRGDAYEAPPAGVQEAVASMERRAGRKPAKQ
jgi:recombination protein RecT